MKKVFLFSFVFLMTMILGLSASEAVELLVQTKANTNNALVGGSGDALITVVVTKFGKPLTNLGHTVGNGVSKITLPTEWTLEDGFNMHMGIFLYNLIASISISLSFSRFIMSIDFGNGPGLR